MSAAAHGYARSPDLAALSNTLHLALAALKCTPLFEWVPSLANYVGIPSRPQGVAEEAFYAAHVLKSRAGQEKWSFPLSQILNFLSWIPFLNSKQTVGFLHTYNCQIIFKIVSQQKEKRELSSLWFSDVSHIKRKYPAYKRYMRTRKRVDNVLHLWKSTGILCLWHLAISVNLQGTPLSQGSLPLPPPALKHSATAWGRQKVDVCSHTFGF